MKKTLKMMLIAILSLGVVVTLAGCGNDDDDDKKSTRKERIEDATREISEVKDNIENEIGKIQEEISNATNEVTTQNKEFSMGEWNGNVYKNDFLGLQFNLPSGWKYSSDEEIAEMMNIGKEVLNDDQKLLAEASKANAVYYMSANNPNTGDSVSISSEKQTMDVSVDFYLTSLKQQLEAIDSIKYQVGTPTNDTISGVSCKSLTANASISGVQIAQKYYVYKLDNYFVVVIVTSTTGTSGIDNIVSNFR